MVSAKNKATFRGFYKNLAKIAEFVRTASEEAGFDNASIYEIETAVDEACSNIIEHGYGAEGIGDIDCTYQIDKKGLTIILNDHGQPFDLLNIPNPNINVPLKKRNSHGLGIYFMRELMDEVFFSYDETHGNSLTMVKYKE